VHTVQFVLKNIRPETIIVFRNEHSDIGAPFLAGFEQFRIDDGHTYRAGDDLWQQNLCKLPVHSSVMMLTNSLLDRHPSRQGTHPQVDYQMQHDIYSLGVVLLEEGGCPGTWNNCLTSIWSSLAAAAADIVTKQAQYSVSSQQQVSSTPHRNSY
jgi:hypothetical protein